MPKLPLEQFKGINLKPGDNVILTVAAIGNGEVQFEYVDPKDKPASKEADTAQKAVEPTDPNTPKIKQPDKPIPTMEEAEKMSTSDLRERLPVKEEE